MWKGFVIAPCVCCYKNTAKGSGDRCHKHQRFLQTAYLGTSTCLLLSSHSAYLGLFFCPFIATISSSLPLEVCAAFSQVSLGMAAEAFIS